MGHPNWKPGEAPYATWLKTLTPEEKLAHLEERKIKKSMRQAMKETIEANQNVWIQAFNNAGVTLMRKAIEEGDVQAFTALYDRLIGKPQDTLDVTSGGDKLKSPTIIFQQTELNEWRDIDDLK
jgi:hypothetical protein